MERDEREQWASWNDGGYSEEPAPGVYQQNGQEFPEQQKHWSQGSRQCHVLLDERGE